MEPVESTRLTFTSVGGSYMPMGEQDLPAIARKHAGPNRPQLVCHVRHEGRPRDRPKTQFVQQTNICLCIGAAIEGGEASHEPPMSGRA